MKQNDEMMTKSNEHCDLKHLAFGKKILSREFSSLTATSNELILGL